MNKIFWAAAAALTVVVIVGAVLFLTKDPSSTNNSSTTDTTSSQTNTESSANDTVPSETNPSQPSNSSTVTIADMAFSPSSITVKKGTTVTWTNNDSMAHTVTATNNQDGPDSGNIAAGAKYSFTFNTVGTFKYDCTYHPTMTGTVEVTE